MVKRGANAGKLLAALPASATDGDVGLLYNRIQWLRRKDRDEEAWKMLLDAPSEPAKLIDPRRLVERAAPQLPYRAQLPDSLASPMMIAAKHGPISGDDYVEAEFLAGWIALRFLTEPKTALGHFLALRAAAKGSKQLALGRILARPHVACSRRRRLGARAFPRRREVSRNISTVSSAAKLSTPSPPISR